MKKLTNKQKIKFRIRQKIKGTSKSPRLTVFRSNKQIYAQLIDDTTGTTLVSSSSKDQSLSSNTSSLTKVEIAKQVGNLLAKKAKELNINSCVFDRNGNLYHGRVKSLAEGAREGGLLI